MQVAICPQCLISEHVVLTGTSKQRRYYCLQCHKSYTEGMAEHALKVHEAQELHADGHTLQEIATVYGVSKQAVFLWLNKPTDYLTPRQPDPSPNPLVEITRNLSLCQGLYQRIRLV